MIDLTEWLLSKMKLVDDPTEEPEMEAEGADRIYFKVLHTYTDCKAIIDNYKEGAACIFLLNSTEVEAQGMMNYVRGGIYALRGMVEKVGENMFMIMSEKE